MHYSQVPSAQHCAAQMGDAPALSHLFAGSAVDTLSAFFSYHSSSALVVTGAAVCMQCMQNSSTVYGCSPLPVRNHPPTEWAAGCPEECAWVDLETRADHITHEPWQQYVCACEQQLTTICRQQRGAEVRTLITNICLPQGSWWDR